MTTTGMPVVSEGVCSICLENMSSDERAVNIPCGHEFHYSCTSAWSSSGHSDCSYCRQKISSIRYHILSDRLFDEDEVAAEESPTLQFAYTVIGNGIFLHSLQPFDVYEVINSTRWTVQLDNSLRASSTPIPPGAHFQLRRLHLNDMDSLTIETQSGSLSLATALLRLRGRGRDVFTEQRSLPWNSLLERLDGTRRVVHSAIHSPDMDEEGNWSPDAADGLRATGQRLRRRERRRGGG